GLPYIYQSKLITVPENSDVQIMIKHYDSLIIPYNQSINLARDKVIDTLPLVFLGKAGIMRDLKVAPLNVRQYFFDKSNRNIICYNNFDIEIKFPESPTQLSNLINISNEWLSFYEKSILNFDKSAFGSLNLGLPQGYLIIVADNLYNNILPLARWKNLKGWTVTVKLKSEVGSSWSEIRNYIRQAYLTWSPKIEYVLLVGVGGSSSPNYIPAVPSDATYGDHLYSCVDGDDLYPDLFIGRLPAATTSELAVMVAKIIGYEQTPYLTDTTWFRRALMVATSYQQNSTVPVWTALALKRNIRNLLLQHDYITVDTVFYPPTASGVGTIDTIINRGVTFVNGRGWGNREGWNYPYFKIQEVINLNNGWKLPIVTSFYCATGNYTAYPSRCFGEAWLYAGSPTNPKGAVAFYGPIYANTSTRFNNCQDLAIYWGIFKENIFNCGPAMFRGKLEMLNNFPLLSDTLALNTHVNTYNLLGDPSLDMWAGVVPTQLIVSYPSEIPVGSSTITITVTNTSSQRIANALVSLYKQNEIKQSAFTDNLGNVTFNFTTNTPDTLFVTVTKHNYIPHLGYIRVVSQPVYVGFYSYSGNTIAGQQANLMISLKNYGTTQSANNTIATLRTTDNHITMIDSIKNYGDIAPGQIVTNGPFQFAIAPNCTNNHVVNFQLIVNSGSNNWQAGFSALVSATELAYRSHIFNDGNNNVLEPGETSNLIIKIFNYGSQNITNVLGILRATNPYAINVVDSLGYFGNINVGDTVQNNTDYFVVSASPLIGIGRKFYLQLLLQSGNYQRIIEFPIIIGQISSTSPLGPDAYGYWAYDNSDIGYSECPTYDWYEIDPNFGGSGTRISLGDDGIR
ncbi:MAG: C25 family cysteine peptidase, partial [candidate division WOR-3 bacterium]